jgi:glycosyltransferase involved in cell wall biosynthesis
MLPAADEHFARPVVFCDRRTMESIEADGPRIEPVWYDTSAASITDLAGAIARNDPDAVVIQHQPGLITWRGLADLLDDRRLRRRISVVVLHTTQHLMEIEETERTAAVAAMARASRVLVHRLADLEFLRRLGLSTNVVVFPQGAPSQAATPVPRALDPAKPDAAPVIGCFGFFLPGKGIPRLIAAAAELRRTWPHLRVKLVNSEYPVPTSAAEIASCRSLAQELGIADCIDWHTGFLPVDQCLELLSGCDLLVLPYDETKESSSSAVRTALASGVPVAVTPVAIFDDAGPAVHRFAAIETAAVATGIDALLRDAKARKSLKAAAGAWLEARSWPSLGQRLRGMLLGLRAQRAMKGGRHALQATGEG